MSTTIEAAIVPAKRMHGARRIRVAAALVLVGLLIELVSLRWAHPTAFIVFAAGTGACVACGVVLFLSVLFGTGPTRRIETRATSAPG